MIPSPSKICFKCNIQKTLSDFYPHAQMADGHLNKCKSCAKADSKQHRRDHLEKARLYDKMRARTTARRKNKVDYGKRFIKKHPERVWVNNTLHKALRVGKIKKSPCQKCGELEVQGHHEDYSKPLDVIWLCVRCHHAAHGRLINSQRKLFLP